MFFSPSKQTTSFLLSEARIPVIHTLPSFSPSLSLHACLPCLTPPSTSSHSSRSSSPLFLAHVFFFFSFFAIMESPLSTCDSLFHQPKPDRKKSQMLVSPLCLSGSVCPLSVGEAAFLQGAPITPIGLPLSARLFPIEACVSQRPSSRFKQKLGG